MVFLRFLVLLLVGLLNTIYAQDFYVVAPNTLRLNSDETIAVTIDGPDAAMVKVLIHDYPGKARNISQILLRVSPGQPEVFKVHLNPADFPPNFLNAPGSPKFVSLDVQSDTFQKEITIPISTQSGYVFIQTDKPIYTPKQMVHIRIIPLNEDSLHSNDIFKLQIKNPNGNIVEEKTRSSSKAFVTHTYKFPVYPILGEWSATVLYGYEFQQNSTVRFDLEEYVLPTFTVELKTPEVILPSTEAIKVSVLSQYAYGKKVQGIVTFRIGIKRDNSETTFFAVIGPKKLREGASELRFNTDNLKGHKDAGWFPEIDGSRLVVEATVVDHATGNNEVAEDSKGRFTISPFIISFKRCLTDFKPGYASVFEADIYYVSGTPAVGIPAKIKASADNEQLSIVGSTATSDENGKVAFAVQTELHHNTVSVTIETDDPKYVGNQAKGNFVQRKFESPSEAYIALDRSIGQRLQVNDTFRRLVHFVPEGIRNIYYLVVARGKILIMNKVPRFPTVDFKITHEMVPSFRVLLFAHFRNELLADSLKFEVERVCNRKAQVSITPDYKIKEPGSNGEFIIRGTKGTFVGLLAVDEAVYALSKKDLLTNSKVFNKFDTHDLGCGPGGGMNVNTVLGNAGITIGTNTYSPSLAHTCVEIKRRKREAALDIVNTFTGVDRMCCSLGIEKDRHHRNCQERTNIVAMRELTGQYENCSSVFLECCTYAVENGLIDLKLDREILARTIGDMNDELDFLDHDDEKHIERDLTVRSDFRETWIFDDIQIGVDGMRQYSASLPHSITTWVIQAVSFSTTHGICVAEPQKLVSFKKVFLHLNLPYSVVRNEQVEIQATVFNYGYKPITAIMYMYGTKDLCTGSQPGEKSEKQKVVVDAQSAASAFFPVIPLKAENYPIKIIAFSAEGSDVIIRTLHVVHEGVPKEITIPIKLDPTNRQNRTRRHVYDQYHTDTIHPDQNLQVTTVKLNAPEGFVPGTASCSISALGDQYGTVIETAINDPDALFQKPRGCGEQNMVLLAPTLYTVRYLKVTGKLTPEMAEKGYNFIRIGYDNQLKYRKRDGSYAAFPDRPSSLWLTAFVTKVFCQATEYVYIDNNVMCSGVKWLIDNQESDGSFIESHPMLDLKLMGGVQGKTPMTAFTLIALQECKCDEENLHRAKMRAVAYLEIHLTEVNTSLAAAIVAYALALSNSELKEAANDKLLSMMETDEDVNTIYWTTDNDVQDIQTAGYGLLTQLLFNDLKRSNAIVNWLNTKQQQSGCYKSTQDTVIALQALSEYSIRAQMPTINLVTNISSSNDRDFHRVLTFHKDNALLLQEVKVDKIGGTLFINTGGEGVGSLAVKLRYNLLVPPEEICKFDVTVNVSDEKIQKKEAPNPRDILEAARRRNISRRFPDATIRDVALALDDNIHELETVPKQRRKRTSRVSKPARSRDVGRQRGSKQNPEQDNSKPGLKISICVRYLGNDDAGMSIVEVGIFSGFEPLLEDLKALLGDPNHLIERYEKSGRGVAFYLEKIPTEQNYCFSFHVVREYIVGNTQTSVIKVYDYYNPDATCTKFYSPSSHSPILRTICEGGICECAEGGCPPRKPFASFYEEPDQEDRRQMLLDEACEAYDYVWKGELHADVRKEGGFLNISFLVEKVIKEGIEKRDRLEGEVRTLLARDNCGNSCPRFLGQTYVILGRDGQKYKNSNGNTWHRYILDKNSAVHMWTSVKESANRELQRDLNFVTDKLLEEGCKL